MRVLHLTLKKKWFVMTDIGDKPEEYREITPYWRKRLMTNQSTFKQFDQVFARNGYNPKKNPSWLRKWEGTSIGYGQEKWGAEPGKKYFVIKLGERINP